MSAAPQTICMGTGGVADTEPRQASSALEAALAAIPGDDLASAKARGLVKGYDARWLAEQGQYRVISVEDTIEAPLINPATGRGSRTFSIAGKLDVRAERNGRAVLIDHKTTSESIDDLAGAYWRQLVIEAQPTHYMLLEFQNGRKVDEAVWDVVKKPDIRPKKLASKEVQQIVHGALEYFGYRLTDRDWDLMKSSEGRESMAMYEARLAWDCTIDRPMRYFQRRPVRRLDDELYQHAEELWGHADEIRMARANERHPRNAGACMNYGRPCVYLGICSGFDSPDSSKWTRKHNVHAELPVLDGEKSRDVLTNSRIKCFQTCRRKHYYQYELGIERVDEEEAEALYFGTLFHLALEKYWSWFIGKGDRSAS
jgi:hypothetical protein